MANIGELASLGAALIWAVSLVIFKSTVISSSPLFLNLYRCTVGALCAGIFLWLAGLELPAWSSDSVWFCLSGFVGLAAGDSFFFAALKRIGAQTAACVQCLAPLLTAMLGQALLSEYLSAPKLAGIVVTSVAVLGSVWFLEKEAVRGEMKRDILLGLGFAVLAATCQALGIIMVRAPLQRVDPVVGFYLRLVFAAGSMMVLWFFMGGKKRLADAHWLWHGQLHRRILIATIFGTFVGGSLMTIGIRFTSAGVAAALSSTYPVWVVALARGFLKEKIRPLALASIILAVAGVILMTVSS